MSELGLLRGVVEAPAPGGAAAALLAGRADASAGDDAVRAAQDFESVLLHRLMSEMQNTVPESGLLESGVGDQVRSIFWFYLAQDVADKGGLGLWKDLYRQWSRQAAQAAPAEVKP